MWYIKQPIVFFYYYQTVINWKYVSMEYGKLTLWHLTLEHHFHRLQVSIQSKAVKIISFISLNRLIWNYKINLFSNSMVILRKYEYIRCIYTLKWPMLPNVILKREKCSHISTRKLVFRTKFQQIQICTESLIKLETFFLNKFKCERGKGLRLWSKIISEKCNRNAHFRQVITISKYNDTSATNFEAMKEIILGKGPCYEMSRKLLTGFSNRK